MSISQILFSPSGRIPRSTYWIYGLIITGISVIIIFIDYFLGTLDTETGVGCISSIFTIIFLVPGILVSIKRCHDRDRSGWFLLLSFIPFLNIWVAIELAFLKGTTGSNQYGPDPLGPGKSTPDKDEYQYDYGPFTNLDSDPFGSDTYTGFDEDPSDEYIASLGDQSSQTKILGMSPIEIAVVGVLVIAICVLGGFVGMNFLNTSADAVAIQPTATLLPSATPPPTSTPFVKVTPLPGWSQFKFAEDKAEIWLPSSYQGGDTVAYPEIVAMTIDTFISDEFFAQDAKNMIADPNIALFGFDTQPAEVIPFMFVVREPLPPYVEFRMKSYLDTLLDQMGIDKDGGQVTERSITSLDYYDDVGVLVIQNLVPLDEAVSMYVKLSIHAIKVDDDVWGIMFRTSGEEFDAYFPTIENSVRSFYIEP